METRIDNNGYEVLRLPVRKKGVIRWHIVVAEKALGRQLPKGAVVHHANEIRHDNRPSNLVICPDRAYHHLLHQRLRAKKICGHVNWLRCGHCKKYDRPENMFIYPHKHQGYHRTCASKYNREYVSKNSNKMRAYHINYQEENKIRIKAQNKKRWELNKDQINARRRKK